MTALYDVDEIMAEVFGNGIEPTDDELDAVQAEVVMVTRVELEEIIFENHQRELRRQANDYRGWWLKRFTMDEIRWLAAGLEHLG